MIAALKQLLGEMIDTLAESNPGLARAWHKLLEESCDSSADCSAGSGGTDGVKTAGETTGTATPSSANAAPVAHEAEPSSSDSPPPVPEWTSLNVRPYVEALTANRDWWKRRAEELEDELAAANNQIDTKVRESEKVWQRIRDLERQVARQMAEIDRLCKILEAHNIRAALTTPPEVKQ